MIDQTNIDEGHPGTMYLHNLRLFLNNGHGLAPSIGGPLLI